MRTNELSFKTLQDIIHVTSGYIVVVELEDPSSTDGESVQLITDPKEQYIFEFYKRWGCYLPTCWGLACGNI